MSTSAFFFGGFNASQSDIDAWLRSAKQLKPNVAFSGFPWTSGPKSYPADTVVKGCKNSGQYKTALDAIQACTADTIYIVGHSSGCAVANAVDDELNDRKRIVLVALDGVTPDDAYDRPDMRMWAAENGPRHQSKNFPGMKKAAREKLKVHTAIAGCTLPWSLHFSLVNAKATDKLLKGNPLKYGYDDCEANLAWLELVV
jgi:hypothetical protein